MKHTLHGYTENKGARVKCLKCNDVIQSMYTHDFIYCSCKNIFVDGGGDYLRMGGKGIEDKTYKILKEIYEDK